MDMLKPECHVLFFCDDIDGMTSIDVAVMFSKCLLEKPVHITKKQSNQNFCYLQFENKEKAGYFYYSYLFKENTCKRFRNSLVKPLTATGGGGEIVYDVSLYKKRKEKNIAKSCKCVVSKPDISVTTSKSSSHQTTNNIGTINVNTNANTTKVNTKDNTTQTNTSYKTTGDAIKKTRDIVKRLISDVNEEIKLLEEKLELEKKKVKLLQDVYDI